jgi:uncharacterized membrane protein YbhN (UPF0104 family)
MLSLWCVLLILAGVTAVLVGTRFSLESDADRFRYHWVAGTARTACIVLADAQFLTKLTEHPMPCVGAADV